MKPILRKTTFAVLAVTLAFLLVTSPAFAQKNWVGPNPDNDWFTPANWSPTGAPALTDDTAIGNNTQATIALPGATTQDLDLGVLRPGILNVSGTGELTAGGNVFVGGSDDGTLNITGGGTVRHPGFDGTIGNAAGTTGVATVTGAGSNWLLHNLVIGNFGHGTLNILNGGLVTVFDAFIAQKDNSTGLAVVNGAGGASTLQLGGNFFVGGDATGAHGTGVLRVLNGGIVNSNRLVVLSTGTLEIGANPMITVTNAAGIEYDGGTLKTIADTTLTNNGSLQTGGVILDSNGFTSTLSGVYSGSGGVTKIGAGTMILSGGNTYTGSTHIDGGVLQIDGSIVSSTTVDPGGTLAGSGLIDAIATNNGIVSPGSPGTVAGTLTIVGTYGQTNLATLRIDIGGLAPAQHDLLAVTSSVTLAGTLQLVRLNNFTPVNGDQVIIMTHAPINNNGQFFPVSDNFPGLIQPHVFYDTSDVRVVFTLANSFASQALTPNQESVAHNIDSAVNDPAAAALIGFLGNEPMGNLPHDYDLIAPEELASIYEIGFSQAVVQNNNLQRRMDDIRAGSNGYCGPTVEVPRMDAKDYKASIQDKNVAPAFVSCPENRWGVFVTGTGDFVNVGNEDDNAHGYDLDTGSVTVGVDYRLGNHFAVGIDGSYTSSTADLVDNGRIDADGGKIGGYATFFGKGLFGSRFHVDGAVDGGWNSYDTLRTGLQNLPVRGSTNGSEFNGLIAYGADWTFGCLNIGTWSTLQYTNVSIDSFTEQGSLAPLEIQDQNEDSFRGTSGIRASYDIKAGRCAIVRPEVRAAWQHEYGDQAYPIDARFASGAGGIFTVHGPTIGRDAALVGAGLSVQWCSRFATYVFYDGVLGRDNYDNNAVSGGLRFGF